jgi:hypothetical protein
MALDVTEGSGASIKTTLDGSDHVPHHHVDSSALPTGAATAANQSTLIGHVDGIETTLGAIDTKLGTIDGDTGTLAVVGGGTETGALRVTIANNSTGVVSVDDNGGSITVDGSVALAAAIPAGTNNIGDVDVLSLPALPTGSNVIGALTANQSVNVAQMNGVATTMGNGASGTGVQRVTLASDSTGNIATIGTSVTPGTAAANLGKAEDAAHGSGDVGVMALAVRRDADTSLVGTDGDYAPLQVNATGAAKVADAAVLAAINAGTVSLASLVSGVLTNTDGASTAVIAAQGSGVITYLTDATITNSSGAAVMVEIKDGATAKWRVLIPAGGGWTHKFASPLVGTANTAWNVDAASATTTLYASFSGFKV